MALNESRNKLAQNSITDIRYDINRRIIVNELVAAGQRVDSSKGFDRYNLQSWFLKSFTSFAVKLPLQFFNACLDTGFWFLNKVSVRLLKKRGKTIQMLLLIDPSV